MGKSGQISDEHFMGILGENIGIVIKVARAYTKVEQDREDLINDITLELWRSLEKFNGESKLSTWIYRLAINTAMNFNRSKRKESFFVPLNDIDKNGVPPWITVTDDPSEIDILYDCVDELNEINKAIVLLYLDGKSHSEISEITGISKTNVGTRLGRIKEQLKTLATPKI